MYRNFVRKIKYSEIANENNIDGNIAFNTDHDV